jgi:hypothetical protein
VENTRVDDIEPDRTLKSHYSLPKCRLITAKLKKS